MPIKVDWRVNKHGAIFLCFMVLLVPLPMPMPMLAADADADAGRRCRCRRFRRKLNTPPKMLKGASSGRGVGRCRRLDSIPMSKLNAPPKMLKFRKLGHRVVVEKDSAARSGYYDTIPHNLLYRTYYDTIQHKGLWYCCPILKCGCSTDTYGGWPCCWGNT